MRPNRHIINGILFLAVLFAFTFLTPMLSSQNPLDIQLKQKFQNPSVEHPFGTDELGRDVFTRVLYGFSTTIRVSILALCASFVIGITLGSIAGFFYGSLIDTTFNWHVSLIFCLPFLLLMASIMSILTPNIVNAYIVLACVMWVGPARIARAEVIRTRMLEHVLASRAMGNPEWRILFRDIMPATLESSFIFALSYFPEIIGLEAGLSFLGLGVQPPDPGLGKMIFDGLNYIYSAWWLAFCPAMVLFVIILLTNLFIGYRGKRAYGF